MGITVQTISQAGISPTFAAATTDGDTFPNIPGTYVAIDNAAASEVTVTFTAQTPCNQGYLHDLVVTVPAGKTVNIGPFPGGQFNDANGNVTMTYSSATSVTVAALRMPS